MRSGSPYLLVSNVNEPVSLPVRIIMRPVIHVGRYFITYSSDIRLIELNFRIFVVLFDALGY